MRIPSPTGNHSQGVAELRTSNTYAVVTLDRRWATVALVHVDPLGSLYPFQWGTAVTAETAGGSLPALTADVVTRAWRDMASKAPATFDRCIICVTPSLTRSRDASSRIAIEPLQKKGPQVPRVTAEHLSLLRETICTQNVSGSFAVTEIVTQGYRNNEGLEVPDPIGMITTSLEMRAHLIMTDQAVLTAAMDALRMMRVRVHAVVSPCAASVANAAVNSQPTPFISIEISESDIVGALVCDGRIVRTLHVDMGSADIVKAAAKRLGTLSRTLSDWISKHHELMIHGLDETSLASANPPGKTPPATLRELYEAGAETTNIIAEAIRKAIKQAMPAASAWPVIVTGDDRFSCRTITPALCHHAGLKATLSSPGRIHGLEMIAAPGTTRLFGAVRYWNTHDEARNAAIEAYYEKHWPAVTQRLRRMQRQTNDWCRRQGVRWRQDGNPVTRIVRTLQSLLF